MSQAYRTRRRALLRRYITDDHAPARTRAIACLMLFYAQPLSRLLRLTTSDITYDNNGQVLLHLGHPPAPVPEPFASLLLQLITDRPATTSNWLFPGRNPGEPAAYTTVFTQLRNLGFPFIPQLQAQLADTTALRDDAAERGWHTEVARHSRVIARIQNHLQRLTSDAPKPGTSKLPPRAG